MLGVSTTILKGRSVRKVANPMQGIISQWVVLPLGNYPYLNTVSMCLYLFGDVTAIADKRQMCLPVSAVF